MKRPDLLKYIEAFIESMVELKRRYEAALELGISKYDYEAGNGMSCLLCNPIGLEVSHRLLLANGSVYDEACKSLGCPWVVMEGVICDERSRQNLAHKDPEHTFQSLTVYNSRDPEIIRNRIAQLEEWIEIYRSHKEE